MQAGIVHCHQRLLRPVAGLVYGTRHQLLAGARFIQQQHGGQGWRHACHQHQHVLKSRGAADHFLCALRLYCRAKQCHLLDKKRLLALGIAQRRQFDVHVLLAVRRVVPVQHALALARSLGPPQRARLARLVAGLVKVVRHLVAGAGQHAALRAELAPVRRIRRQVWYRRSNRMCGSAMPSRNDISSGKGP